MNKKIAMSGLSIMAALMMLGGATYAQFASSATTTENTFATGNADLRIAVDTGAGEPSEGSFLSSIAGANFDNIAPGFDDRYLFWLKNTSESNIDLNLTADLLNLDQDPDNTDPNTNLDEALLIRWVCDLDGNHSLDPVTETTSEFSVRQWIDGGFASLGSLNAGETMFCGMYSRVPMSVTNDIANETISFDVKYDATQVVVP